jgi:hypothetical protein
MTGLDFIEVCKGKWISKKSFYGSLAFAIKPIIDIIFVFY